MRTSNSTEKSYWSQTVPFGSRKVYAWERLDRNGAIFLKFKDDASRARDGRVKVRLPGNHSVRDAKGKILQSKVRTVVREIEEFISSIATTGLRAETQAVNGLSLLEGFDMLLDTTNGKFASKTLRWQEIERAKRKIEKILNMHLSWTDITPHHARSIWRSLARENVEQRAQGVRSRIGVRQAEVTVDALYSTAAWLRDEGLIPQDAGLPQSKWRLKLKEDWRQLGADVRAPTVRVTRAKRCSDSLPKCTRLTSTLVLPLPLTSVASSESARSFALGEAN